MAKKTNQSIVDFLTELQAILEKYKVQIGTILDTNSDESVMQAMLTEFVEFNSREKIVTTEKLDEGVTVAEKLQNLHKTLYGILHFIEEELQRRADEELSQDFYL